MISTFAFTTASSQLYFSMFDLTQRKSKALVLAALARSPYESRSIDISDAEEWIVRVTTTPSIDLKGEIELLVMLSDGKVVNVPALDGIKISGKRVTASFLKEMNTHSVTIILEAV